MNVQIPKADALVLREILECMKAGRQFTVSRRTFELVYARLNANLETADLFGDLVGPDSDFTDD